MLFMGVEYDNTSYVSCHVATLDDSAVFATWQLTWVYRVFSAVLWKCIEHNCNILASFCNQPADNS